MKKELTNEVKQRGSRPFVRMLTMLVLFFATAIATYAQDRYIEDVVVAEACESMKVNLQNDGYQVFDLRDCPTLLGIKYTTDAKKAVTDLLFFNGEAYKPDKGGKYTVGGRQYEPCKCYSNDPYRTINHHDHSNTYLYKSYSNPDSGVVQKLEVKDMNEVPGTDRKNNGIALCPDGKNKGGDAHIFSYRQRVFSSSMFNILMMVRVHPAITIEAPGRNPNLFKVTNAGGGLYQIDLPLIAVTSGETWYIPGSGKTMSLEVKKQDGGNWTKVITFTGVTFDGIKSSCSVKYEIPNDVKFALLESVSMNALAKSGTLTSNNTDGATLNNLPLLVKMEGGSPYEFRISGTQNRNGSSIDEKIEQRVIPLSADNDPDGLDAINAMTVVGPTLDMSSAGSAYEIKPGKQIAMVASPNDMTTIGIWDTHKEVFVQKINPSKPDDYVLTFDPSDQKREYAIVAYGKKANITGSGTVYTNAFYTAPLIVQPFHSIKDVDVTMEKNVDDKGVFSQKNIITWKVDNYEEEDCYSDDQYIVQRAHRADFTDAATVALLDISGLGEEFVKLDKDTGVATFTVTDKVEDGWYDAQNDSTEHKVYYRVSRSMALSMWERSGMGQFAAVDSLPLLNYLSPIEAISVEKTKGFDQDKTIKVKVKIPYIATQEKIRPIYGDINLDFLRSKSINGDDHLGNHLPGFFYLLRSDHSRDLFLSIENQRVVNRPEPLVFYISNETFYDTYITDINGNNIVWSDGEPPFLYVSKIDRKGFGMGHNGTDFAFDRLMSGSDNEYHYLDDGSFSTQRSWWNLIPYSEELLNDPNYRKIIGYKNASVCHIFDPKSNIKIHRYSPESEHYQGKDYAEKVITIPGSDVKYDAAGKFWYAEVEDVQSAPYTHYYYSATIDKASSGFYLPKNTPVTTTKEEADACYSEGIAPISKMTASNGTVQGKVVVEWEMDEGLLDEFTLERADYGTQNWTQQPLSSTKAKAFVDSEAAPGKVYSYRLTAICSVRGEKHSVSKVVHGYNSYYATFKGNVKMKNGSMMPGEIQVTAKLLTDVKFDKVEGITDGLNVPSGKEYTTTTTDGTFEFDKLPYMGGGTKYEIKISGSTAKFTDGSGTSGNTFDVKIDTKTYEQTKNYVCADTRKFAGRVLYAGTTIPVRDCEFLMNGKPVLDGKGESIKTDSKGEFSFILPQIAMTLQVCKPGHRFDNDGYIKAVNSDATGKEHEFLPTEDYVVPHMYDFTTVRLVGRIIGGDNQAQLPLGFGVAKNNLGDNLKIVMELEGDNTAQMVYNPEHPDQTTRTENVSQVITDQTGAKTSVNNTSVVFEKKRIVITPDETTGEFAVDIAPTRYKITELSAKGYPTLFNEGEGFQVLDISNDYELKTDEYFFNSRTYKTSYNSTYQRVYHSPVNVTYKQLYYGSEVGYRGEETMTEQTLDNQKVKVTIAKYDKKSGKTDYLFGSPVFAADNVYQFLVSAHEDYFYNDDHSNEAEVVNIKGGKLKVYNGFASNSSEEIYELNEMGMAIINVLADNTTFSLTEKEALRTLTMQVEANGYYYDAEPLKAFVTGYRDKGVEVATLESGLTVLDVIRDPYGSGSYAYRDKGTKYHWDRTLTYDVNLSLNLSGAAGIGTTVNSGAWAGFGGGAYVGSTVAGSTTFTASVPLPLFKGSKVKTAKYDMTLTDRISTSSDPADVGADADVYVGLVNTIQVGKMEVISILDQKMYDMVKGAIASGGVRILKKGDDGAGNNYYLAVTEKYNAMSGKPAQFAYTQKYITGTLIPNLVQMYKSLILTGTREEIQKLADATNEVKYRLKDGKSISDEDCHEAITPKDETKMKTQRVNPESCQKMIREWIQAVTDNEAIKLAMSAETSNPYKTVSVSSGSSVSHSQLGGGYFYDLPFSAKIMNVNISKGQLEGDLGITIGANKDLTGPGKLDPQKVTAGKDWDEKAQTATFDAPGVKFLVTLGLSTGFNASQSSSYDVEVTGGTGYYISTNNESYLEQDLYQVDPFKISDAIFDNNAWTFVTSGAASTPADVEAAKEHDYVFVVRGGAQRNPWYDVDRTKYVNPGMALGATTAKIDNPKLYINQPVVSNLPAGEKAVFSIRLTNESELTTGADLLPGVFTLFLDDKSTPKGVSVTMDGMPITDGRTFRLKQGESITKTIQVERAGNDYDYENIRLGLRDQMFSVIDYASLSVHYLPTSTPLQLSCPNDKWVMNTLSPKDSEGRYYLPVEIKGFDINHDNFDHIELQYKKQTEGDSKWVNICSFFSNDSLYQAASGEKAMMIKSGTITYSFYGEADPVEMNYDLRAVSFSRLGSGYVTAVSNVITGKKDTRIPVVFGKPKPTNGVLTFEDVISIPFNEPIAYNYLDKTANFEVTGYTNNSENTYSSLLRFPTLSTGKELDVPASKVRRNLTGSDFTIDVMAKMDSGEDIQGSLFAIMADECIDYQNPKNLVNSENYVTFGINHDELNLVIDGMRFVSDKITDARYAADKLSFTKQLQQIGVAFKQPENMTEGEKEQVQFYMNGIRLGLKEIRNAKDEVQSASTRVKCKAYGEVAIGSLLHGVMSDVRLWNKSLGIEEMTSYRGKKLTGKEPSLLGYWPMDEMSGGTLHDKANGADMFFTQQQWFSQEGHHSLHLQGTPIDLVNAEQFERKEYDDYTLAFWYQASVAECADSTTVFQSGSNLNKDRFTIYLDNEGLSLRSGENKFNIAPVYETMDDKWHSVAVVANKSQNVCALYFDGKLSQNIPGDQLGGLMASAQLGGHGFVGNIDELTFWHLAFPNSACVESNRSSMPKGSEMGLVYYLPFEMDKSNSQGALETVFSPYNEIVRLKENGEVAEKNPIFSAEIIADQRKMAEMDNKTNFAPCRKDKGRTNLEFVWTSNDNELQITINEHDSKINHQQIFVTVRGVEDLAGNSMQNPQLMTVYVDRNVLVWDKQKESIKVNYGEGATFSTGWHNKSGRTVSYTIQENCSWLKPSKTMGNALPVSNDEVTFEISDGLAPGEYSTTVYLVDEDNLSSPMDLSVTVEADEPMWEITTNQDYKLTMNLRGQVKVKNNGGAEFLDMDKRDVVAAFYDGICVGKSNITVDNETNTSMLNMTIFGYPGMNPIPVTNEQTKEVTITHHYLTFLLWRASTNEVCVLSPDTEGNVIEFEGDKMVGCPPEKPVVFTPNNEIKQTIALERGWNWVSFNLVPKNRVGVNMLFDSNDVFEVGDVIMHSDVSSELMYNEKTKTKIWSGDKDALDNTAKYTYQIYVHEPTKATVFGYDYLESKRYVTLRGSELSSVTWCDLAYLLPNAQPINIAMSDYAKDRAKVGTVIKSRKQFAVMDEYGKWVGSLEYMHPGEGYYVKYFGTDSTVVRYTNVEPVAYAKRTTPDVVVTAGEDDGYDGSFDEQFRAEAKDMMPVIANVAEEDEFLDGDEIVAFSKGNMVGYAKPTTLENGRQLFFISVNAADGDVVRFAHVRDGEVVGKSSNGISFDAQTITGTLDVPYTITFDSHGFNGNDDAFGVGGEIYGKAKNIANRRGIFIINGEKYKR